MDWWSEDIFGNECWSIGLKDNKQDHSERILPIRTLENNDLKEAPPVSRGPVHSLANVAGGHFGGLRGLQQGTSVTNINKLNDDHYSDVQSNEGSSDDDSDDDGSDDDGNDDDGSDNDGSANDNDSGDDNASDDNNSDDGNGSEEDDHDDDESGSVIVLDSDSSIESSNVTFPTVNSELNENLNGMDSKYLDCKSNADSSVNKLRDCVVTERTSQEDDIEDKKSIISFDLDISEEIRETTDCVGFMGHDIDSSVWQNNDALEDDVDLTSSMGLRTRNSWQSENMLTQSSVQCDFSLAPANPFSCSLCEASFSYKCMLDQHLITHRPKKLLLNQPDSATNFSHGNSLFTNINKWTGRKVFSCTVCLRTVSSKQNLIQHVRRHTGEKPFSCSVCIANYACRNSLMVHMRTHTGEKPIKSSTCTATFSSQTSQYYSEKSINTCERPFSCHCCNAKFTLKQNLKRHILNNSCKELSFKSVTLPSSLCPKNFRSNSTLMKQMFSHRSERSFLCSICSAKFAQKYQLQSHIRIHTDEKPFSCLICNAKFSRKSSLVIHNTRKHTVVIPFSCHLCHAEFSFKQNLRRHILKHNNNKLQSSIKKFQCSLCTKNFSSDSALKRHMLTHTGEKPFTCSICSARFSQKSNMQVHFHTHADEK